MDHHRGELGLIDGIGELETEMRRRYGRRVQLRVIRPPRDVIDDIIMKLMGLK